MEKTLQLRFSIKKAMEYHFNVPTYTGKLDIGGEEAIAKILGRKPKFTGLIPFTSWAMIRHNACNATWLLRCCWESGGRKVGENIAQFAADQVFPLRFFGTEEQKQLANHAQKMTVRDQECPSDFTEDTAFYAVLSAIKADPSQDEVIFNHLLDLAKNS